MKEMVAGRMVWSRLEQIGGQQSVERRKSAASLAGGEKVIGRKETVAGEGHQTSARRCCFFREHAERSCPSDPMAAGARVIGREEEGSRGV